MRYASSCLIRQVNLVSLTSPAPRGPVDIRITHGRISAIEPTSRLPMASVAHVVDASAEVFNAEGAYAVPGLWDHHVHFTQWAHHQHRLSLRGLESPDELLRAVEGEVARRANAPGDNDLSLPPGQRFIVGFGYRSSAWERVPSASELDAVAAAHPVALVSNDAHHAWLNTAALKRLGLTPDTGNAGAPGLLVENAWFDVASTLSDAPDVRGDSEAAIHSAVQDAISRGITGIVDFEWDDNIDVWGRRFARGIDQLRVRASVYPEHLDDVLAAGLATGDPIRLPGGSYTTSSMSAATGKMVSPYDALLTMGPLKIIADGSITSRTAWCCEPYADASTQHTSHPAGLPNYSQGELTELLTRAGEGGLHVAVHAIGDAALEASLRAFDTTRARGTVEHAQLVPPALLEELARLGLTASVQPRHLLEDRDQLDACMPDRTQWCYPFRDMVVAEVPIHLGSDAPVSELDPWAAMAAAVHRSDDEREPWHQEQALSPIEAILASTDRRGTLQVGDPGDLVLLTDDPLAFSGASREAADQLRTMDVASTFVAGRRVYAA